MAWKLAVAILGLTALWGLTGWPTLVFDLALACAIALIVWEDTRA